MGRSAEQFHRDRIAREKAISDRHIHKTYADLPEDVKNWLSNKMDSNAIFIENIKHQTINTNIIRYQIDEYQKKKQQECVVFNYDMHGYGDTIAAAWVAEGARDSKRIIIFKAKNERKELLEYLGQDVRDDLYNSVSHRGEYRSSQFGSGSPSFVLSRAISNGFTTQPLRPLIQIPNDEKYQEWADKYKADVVICPSVTSKSRAWPWDHWVRLIELLKSKRIDYTITAPKNGFVERQDNYVGGYRFSQLINLFDKAKLFVGPDSGPSHLAGTMNLPGLVMLGRTTYDVHSHMRSLEHFEISRKILPCAGCWGGVGHSNHCEIECHALRLITPEQVFERILQKLDEPKLELKYCDNKYHDSCIADMVELHCIGPRNYKNNNFFGDRHISLQLLAQKAKQRFKNPVILEIGTNAHWNNWSDQGMSTLLFSYYCQFQNGKLFSVDLSPESRAYTQRLLQRFGSTNIVEESDVIPDILYVNDLRRVPEYFSRLKSESLVVLDNVACKDGGYLPPAQLVIEELVNKGWMIVHSGTQVVMEYVG